MDLRQSPQWGNFLASLGWQTEVIDGCALRIKKLGPLGCVIKSQRPENLPLMEIDQMAHRHHALFVKIEPINNSQLSTLNSQFYEPDAWPLTPPRTVVIDLTKSDEELLKNFSKDTRQKLKKIKNEELKINKLDFALVNEANEEALQNFYQIWRETARRGKFWATSYGELSHKVRAFAKDSLLILGQKNDGQTLAGCLLLFCDGVAYYHHAASTMEGQKREWPYELMRQAILESKKRDIKRLDLEGIFDPRFKFMNNPAWHKFSTFKLKWGGQVWQYPGAVTRVYNPLVKVLFWLEKFSGP